MTKKTSECYMDVFKYIEDNIMNLKPNSFMSDWEAGMRKAISICYPDARISGCWYSCILSTTVLININLVYISFFTI